MTRREYLELRAKIERDYRDRLAALETVWNLAKEDEAGRTVLLELDEKAQTGRPDAVPDPVAPPIVPASSPVVTRITRGRVDRWVRDVVEDILPAQNFTLRDVEGALLDRTRLDIPRSSISSALRRLAEAGEIAIYEPGQGRRPATYVKPQPKPEPMEEPPF